MRFNMLISNSKPRRFAFGYKPRSTRSRRTKSSFPSATSTSLQNTSANLQRQTPSRRHQASKPRRTRKPSTPPQQQQQQRTSTPALPLSNSSPPRCSALQPTLPASSSRPHSPLLLPPPASTMMTQRLAPCRRSATQIPPRRPQRAVLLCRRS